MSEKIDLHNVERSELDGIAEQYGNKFAVQKLFVDAGMTSVDTRLFTPDAEDTDIVDAVGEIFSRGAGATVRFSFGKELNLPRGFFNDAEECLQFIRTERRDYALILQEYTQLRDSFELYIDNDRVHLQVMPGIWEVDSVNAPDIVEHKDDQTQVYRYRGSRKAKYLDDNRNFAVTEKHPYSVRELEGFFAEIMELRPQLELIRGMYDPLFCHFIRDEQGRLTFLNIRDFGEIDFNAAANDSYLTIKSADDVLDWDGETPILFDVQSEREDDTPILKAIDALRRAGITNVHINYGTLSHPAILLREGGIQVQQSLSEYEVRNLGEVRAQEQDVLPELSETITSFLDTAENYEGEVDADSVISLTEIQESDFMRVGGKGYNLGILARAGINVPRGFVITSEGYTKWMGAEAFGDKQKAMLARIVTEYNSLDASRIAVRSSATVEDMGDASSAGIYVTSLNIQSRLELVAAMVKGFRSFNTGNAEMYRTSKGITNDGEMPLVVQEMIDADVAGVMFSTDLADPTSPTVINAVRGIGETLVSGRLSGDTYKVSSGELVDVVVNPQDFIMTQDGEFELQDEDRLVQSLTEEQAKDLSIIAKQIEQIYGSPQDIEFAIKDGQIWILQARPITA